MAGVVARAVCHPFLNISIYEEQELIFLPRLAFCFGRREGNGRLGRKRKAGGFNVCGGHFCQCSTG